MKTNKQKTHKPRNNPGQNSQIFLKFNKCLITLVLSDFITDIKSPPEIEISLLAPLTCPKILKERALKMVY